MTAPQPNSLLLQLRARECVRMWSGAASHSALPLRLHAPHRITDELDAASICAHALRSKSTSTLPQHILLGHTGCVNAVAVSDGATSHGRWIASAGDDERVLLWDAYLPVLEVHANSGHTVRFIQSGRSGAHERQSLDSDSAAASAAPRSSTSAGAIHRGFARAFGGHSANIFGLQFTPDSRRIISCGLDAGILMFDLEYASSENGGALRAPIRSFTGHESSVHRTSLIKDSNDVFLSASNDHTCRLFDARASGSRAQLIGGLGYSLNSVHCSPTDEHAFVTAGKALCLHDLRQMHASKPAAPPPTTRSAMGRAQLLARTAQALRRGQMPPDDDDAEEGAGGAGAAGSDDESEFNALLRIMLTGRSSARATPIAVVQSFDLTTLTPPVAEVASRSGAAAARGSARGRGAARGARGRGSAASRSRGRGRGSAAAAAPAAAAPSAGGRGRGRGRGGRGRGARAAAASFSEEMHTADDEMPESDRRASEAADSAAAAPRRSSRLRPEAEPAAAAVEVEDAEDNDGDEPERTSFPTPNERRRERLAQLTPPREASSCEYSSDGRFVLACMMKATPLLFDVTRAAPVLSMQSRGAFSGYSHTCTLKSAVFAGPDDRFVIAGSDNFGIFAWDRTMQREDILGVAEGGGGAASAAASSSSSAVAAPSSSTTFLNACKILRGHRSIPNNQRFHPQLMQILSCGVEKVVRVFNCNRVPADLHQREKEAQEPAGVDRVAGDVLPAAEAQRLLRLEHIPTTQSASAADAPAGAASSASAHKRAASNKLAAQPEEKKARSQRESSSAMLDEGEQERKSSSSAAAASSPSAAASSAAASSSSAASPVDPLYRMVKTYSTVRDPYTRLQCAYLLSGGAAAFGAAAAMFADAESAEEISAVAGSDEPDPRSNDSMAEDRACLAQFDFYVARSVAGEPSDSDGDSEDLGIEDVSSEDDDGDAAGEGGETHTHHTFLDLNSDEERRMRDALDMDEESGEEEEEA